MKHSRPKQILLTVAFMVACNLASAEQLVDLSTGTLFEGTADTTPLKTVSIEDDGITVRYEFSYASVSTPDDGSEGYLWEIPGFSVGSTQGTPAVVGNSDIVNITEFGNIKVEIIESSYIDLPYVMAPTPRQTLDPKLPVVRADEIAPYTGFYPSEPLSVSEPYQVRDGRYASISLSPLQYDYMSKTTRVCKSISYKITADQSKPIPYRAMSTLDRPMVLNDNLESVVINPNTTYAASTAIGENNIGMLIVTSAELAAPVREFIKHKQKLGIRTYLLVLNETTEQTPDDVKSNIQTELTKHPEIKYLMIVGDQNHVPAYSRKISEKGNTYDFLTDLYYTTYRLQYHTSSIARARIPVATADEVKIVLDKITNYELNPPTLRSFYDNYLFAAEFERSIPSNSDSISVYQREHPDYRFLEVSQYLSEYFEQNTEKNIDRYYYAISTDTVKKNGKEIVIDLPPPLMYHNGDTLPESLLNYPFYHYRKVSDIINNGISCFFYNDHGDISKTKVGYFTTPLIQRRLTNGNLLPVVFGVACRLGAYNKVQDIKHDPKEFKDCENFGRAFLKQPNGGCVGIIAATELSWVITNNVFANGLFEGLFPGSSNIKFLNKVTEHTPVYRMGDLLDYSSLLVKSKFGLNVSNVQQHFEYYHYFGDPTMRMRTEYPVSVEQPSVFIVKDNLDKYRLTVYSANGTEYSICKQGEQPVRFNGQIQNYLIDNPAKSNYTLCINGDNMIPYIHNLSEYGVIDIPTRFSANYNAATRVLKVSHSVSSEYSDVYVMVYDTKGNFVARTTSVKPTGNLIEQSISVPFGSTAPYLVSLIVDGLYIKTLQIS